MRDIGMRIWAETNRQTDKTPFSKEAKMSPKSIELIIDMR